MEFDSRVQVYFSLWELPQTTDTFWWGSQHNIAKYKENTETVAWLYFMYTGYSTTETGLSLNGQRALHNAQ